MARRRARPGGALRGRGPPLSGSRTVDRELEALLARLLAGRRELPAVEDWSRLLTRAAQHGVETFLAHELLAGSPGRDAPLPATAVAELEQRLALRRLMAPRAEATLDDLLGRLRGAKLACVPLKGPSLARRLYAEPAHRPSTDLDLLVRDADLDRALDVLTAAGFAHETGPHSRYQRAHHHHVELTRRGAPVVELHFRLFQGFGVAVPSEPFLERSRDGVLAPEDELFYLSVHAAGHGASRLAWLVDLALLARRSGVAWARAASTARSHGLSRAFAFTVDRLRSLGVVVEPGCPSLAARGRAARWLADAAFARPEPTRRGTLAQVAFGAVLCDRAPGAASYLVHHLGRIARRRAQRASPALVPAEWAG